MPAKGTTGTTRRPPLRSDRGVKLYAPTLSKPYFRVVAAGQIERTSAPVPREHLAASEVARFTGRDLDPETARSRREADIRAFEEVHMVHASELDLESELDADAPDTLPPAKRAQPRRRAR